MSTIEGITETVKAVHFSFLTDEDVRKISVKQLSNPILFDELRRPLPNGLYDPVLGSTDDDGPCRSCGQVSLQCPGHCGHIDLVLPVYNPLLFQNLLRLLKRMCFFCHHFMMNKKQVQLCVTQLELIIKGDIVRSKNLEGSFNEPMSSEEENASNITGSAIHTKAKYNSEHLEPLVWTSLQFDEATSVLDAFMKGTSKKCQRCEIKNPTISCPTFGWIHMSMSDNATRGNVIKGYNLANSITNVAEERSSIGEVENSNHMFPGTSAADSSDMESSGAVYDGTPETAKTSRRSKGGSQLSEFLDQKSLFSGPLLPSEVKNHMKLFWENETEFFSLICDIQRERSRLSGKKGSYSMFFMEALLVPPTKFRPPAKEGLSVIEHPQTVLLSKVLQSNIDLAQAYKNNSDHSKITSRWMDLQLSVNVLVNSKTATSQKDMNIGICQLLEKKEGIFRQKMMGKRVNYACRSVISPDPYLAVNEIGIPPYFALRLTYPEKVTPWNVNKLREAILAGGEQHPGATHYVDSSAKIRLPPSRKKRTAYARKLPSSRGVVTQAGKSVEHELEGKVVYRHLQDGDIVLLNRQPTLHKPSIMAHVVRVLKGEKTLRMHYANCSVYNADFDGDEMNVHFPQDEISRAEAFHIVNANEQYIVPTSGDPIRGLIQDHIVSAVLLTKKDTFLTGDEFRHLLYSSGVSAAARGSFVAKPFKKVFVMNSEDDIQDILPAIWKPEPLWTGKQVITALLSHITRTRGLTPFTVQKEGKTEKHYFGKESGEASLLVHKNELVHGVIDKAQFGQYGLVHTVQELYGSNIAGVLLSVLSRLFTVFLQTHGFTCGVDDLLIIPEEDNFSKKSLQRSGEIGADVHSQFIGAKDADIDPMTLQVETEKFIRTNGESAIISLDGKMISDLNELTTTVNEALFPKGLLKPFPKNCLSLMTATGAKGNQVNFTQISSLLGQQMLEGKRVPRMVSGKSLPCFSPWEYASRAGGFISDRFLTGLRPQEYYFHCMAGREGLVDTAVKTSRSGYLQRCIVKNLECLKVCYDHTVRDADGSVVQFYYGEDGIDVHKTSFVFNSADNEKQDHFKILADNRRVVLERLGDARIQTNSYIKELPDILRKKANDFISSLSEEQRLSLRLRKQDFMKLIELKYLSSLAQPGEPVGVIAAQSVGEPSTQMTLNTFHFAGRGEMNVTLGIPRLQEILMRASENIQFPVMACRLPPGTPRDIGERLAAKLKKVTVADVVESMEVDVVPFSVQKNEVSTIYKLRMKLYDPKLFPPYMDITPEECMETLEHFFVRELEDSLQNHMTMISKISGIKNMLESDQSPAKETDDGDSSIKSRQTGEESDDNNDEAEDHDVDAQKRKQQATDEMDYEDDMEKEMSCVENGNIEDELTDGLEIDTDIVEVQNEAEAQIFDAEAQIFDAEDDLEPTSILNSKSNKETKSEAKKKKLVRPTLVKKDTDRHIFVEAKGLIFEVHLRLTNESHILLTQVAQKAAKKVYIRKPGKIDRCSLIAKTEEKKTNEKKTEVLHLETAGVDFRTFWELHEELDVNKIESNDIHAMLNTYGVEAARATLINEIKKVFQMYKISVNIRHLTLIADFMTHTGSFRPLSRYGIASSTSPFGKMSFETASRFIVEAALHGEVDHLESPSARICLGQPVKVGTGSFDLLQKVQF